MKAFRSDSECCLVYEVGRGCQKRDPKNSIRSASLHVHAWRTLITAAGVRFRTSPSFVEGTVDLNQCNPDCGNEVALIAYTETELKKIFNTSVQTLVNQGFNRARSFRAGGWMANDRNAALLQTNPVNDVYFSIGFHQETAADYLPALRSGIDQIVSYAKAQGIDYEFVVAAL